MPVLHRIIHLGTQEPDLDQFVLFGLYVPVITPIVNWTLVDRETTWTLAAHESAWSLDERTASWSLPVRGSAWTLTPRPADWTLGEM